MSTKTLLELMEMIEKKEQLSFDEFILLFVGYRELQFFYKNKKYGMTQFNGFEFYEWDKEESYQSYKTIEEFAEKANICGVPIKTIWRGIKKLNFAD